MGKDDTEGTKYLCTFASEDNQEVGLEAAILSRKRKSSLVELSITENVSGLKFITEAVGIRLDMRRRIR